MKKKPIILLALLLCSTQIIHSNVSKYLGYVQHYIKAIPKLVNTIGVFNKTAQKTNHQINPFIINRLNDVKAEAIKMQNTSVTFTNINAIDQNTNPVETINEVTLSMTNMSSIIDNVKMIMTRLKEVADLTVGIIQPQNDNGQPWGWSTTMQSVGEFMKEINQPSEVASVAAFAPTVTNVGSTLQTSSQKYHQLINDMIPAAQKALDEVKTHLNGLIGVMNGPLQDLHGLAGGQ